MNVRNMVLASIAGALTAGSLPAQMPVLGNLEAPYPSAQSTVYIAGGTYGPGAVAYGPVGTPLVLTGSDLGASGTVQFIGYKNGAVDPGTTVLATVTMWSPTMLFLTVPSGAVSGLVKVTAEGRTSVNGLPFIVTPGTYSGSCPASPPNNQLQITTSALPDGTAGQSYSAPLMASGGTTAYTWSIISGSLPGGMSLNASTGAISGTPTGAAGPMDLTFRVTDSSSPQKSDQAVLSLTVESQTLTPATVYSYTVPSGGFDGDGNITSFQDSIMGTWTFGYDTLNRLVTGTVTAGDFNGQYACWSYDPFGNRTSEALSTTACSNNPPLMSWATYNVSNTNRMDTTSQNPSQSNGYDQAGDVASDGVNSYTYDGDGRVCAVKSEPVPGTYTMIGYLYDAEGNRVAKGTINSMSCNPGSNGFQLTESYLLGQSGEELTMLDGSGAWQRTNVYGAGQLMATYDMIPDPTNLTPTEVPALHFHLTDPLGTRRMQTSAVGQPETDIQSLPFGDLLNSFPDQYAPASADDATPLHYTGKERDSESGNDYFGARYYGSTMGRFLSPDYDGPDDDPEPVPYAVPGNPQTLNLYTYGGNNPLSNIDPSGHDCIYFSSAGNPSVKSGDCISDTDSGIYVNGTVTSLNYNSSNSSWGFTYNSYDNGNLGTGTIANAPAPGPEPQMDEGAVTDESGSLLMGIAGGMAADYALGRVFGALFGKEAAEVTPDLANLSPKIVKQMGTRGWTKDEILQTVKNGVAHDVTNKATGGPAIEYVNPANGKFVVIDKTTNQVLQVSGPGFQPNYLTKP